MTAPENDDNRLLLQALSSLQTGLTDLKDAVLQEADAREHKTAAIEAQTATIQEQTKTIQKQNNTLQRSFVGALLMLLVLLVGAGLNLNNTSRSVGIAQDAKSTNQLLLGCLQPNTPCSDANAKQQIEILNVIRQTSFVIAFCQRRFPADVDPNAAKVIACVQTYYPGFELPAPQGTLAPTVKPSASN